jgi:hypothetical protein
MKMGYLLSITVGTTAAESLNAAANIFLGQTEAPLLIKPFLGIMTKYFYTYLLTVTTTMHLKPKQSYFSWNFVKNSCYWLIKNMFYLVICHNTLSNIKIIFVILILFQHTFVCEGKSFLKITLV